MAVGFRGMANDRHHVPGHGVAQAFALDSKLIPITHCLNALRFSLLSQGVLSGNRARNRNPGGLFSRAAAGGTAHFSYMLKRARLKGTCSTDCAAVPPDSGCHKTRPRLHKLQNTRYALPVGAVHVIKLNCDTGAGINAKHRALGV